MGEEYGFGRSPRGGASLSVGLERAEDLDSFCPACGTCISGGPEQCPECGRRREGEEWKALEFAPHAYLGYILRDRYLLDRYVGGGASGEVYRAIDQKLDRPFALKVVEFGPDACGETRAEEVRRFRNEVQALSRLRNPHVVDIYESFELERHTSALLTEYIEGRTLRAILESEGPLAFRQGVEVTRQVANGLHEAHEEGVVHRDLKPENVMIEQLPAAGYFARLLDFGLVRMVDDASQTDGFRGTPLYAAPEQCRSDCEVDRRADIYGLGCVMFHAFAGRPPFQGTNAIEVIESHTTDEPPTLSESSFDTEIPRRLDGLIDEMLEKEPADRPETLHRVIEVLDTISRPSESAEDQFSGGWAETTEVEPIGEQSTIVTEDEGPPEGSPRRSAETWSTESGALPAEFLQAADLGAILSEYTPGAPAIRLQKRGDCIAVADGSHQAHLIARGRQDYEDSFAGPRMRLTAVAGPRERGGVFAAEMNGRILRWGIDLRSGSPDSVIEVSARVLAMDVDARETGLVVGTEAGEVLHYDLRTGEVSRYAEFSEPVCEVRIAPDGRTAVAATMDGTIEGAAFDGGATETSVQTESREPAALAVDHGARWAAVMGRNGELRMTHLHDADRSFTLSPVPSDLRSLNFSANGQLIGVTLTESRLRIWAFHHQPVLAPDLSRP